MPPPRTLYGPGFLYRIPKNLSVVVPDLDKKVFDNFQGGRRAVYWTQPEWFTAEPNQQITMRSGNPDIDPKNPVYTHQNPIYKI